MKVFAAFLALVIISCTPMQPAFSGGSMNESLAVKGRMGILINQKLSFGPYATSRVQRSWTRTDKASMPLRTNVLFWMLYDKTLSLESTGKLQNLHFTMKSPQGSKADVYATSVFSSEEILASGNPNSGINVLNRMFGAGSSENVYYLQVYLGNREKPWHLMLDNQASQTQAKSYRGVFALDEERYYTLIPVTKVASKGGPKSILMGSVGYEIKDARGNTVAGVSLIDQGQVFFNTPDPEEKFLLANLAAALLLQENLEAQS